MLSYKSDKLTNQTLLLRQTKVMANIFRKAQEYAIKNNLIITSTQFEDDNWHNIMELKCFINNDSYINDKPKFTIYFNYREELNIELEHKYQIIKE